MPPVRALAKPQGHYSEPMPRLISLADLPQFTAVQLLSDPGAVGGPTVIPNCVKVRFLWNLPGGKIAANVLYGRAAAVPVTSVAMAQAIFAALSSGAAWTALAGCLGTDVAFAAVEVQSVHSPQLQIFRSTGAAVPGTGTSTAMANEMAVCLTFRTSKIGRQNRGRIYVPGWANNQVIAGNVVGAAAVTALGNWGTSITAAFSGQSLTHVIGQPARNAYISPITGVSHPARAATSETVTSILVRNNTFDSQRRRGLK